VNTGQVISGIGHTLLIGWALFGGPFKSEPLPFQITEVSVISTDAFQAMLSGPQPEMGTEVALPVQPDAITPDPVETPTPDAAVATEAPAPAAEPQTEATPEPPAPQPEPEIADESPVLPQPLEQAVEVPAVALRPIPRASERIAPEPVAPPDPESAPDEVDQQAVAPDEAANIPADAQDATAPEEAATEIVTEAEKPANAPTASPRPPSRRPSPPTRTVAAPVETPTAPEKPATPASKPEKTDDAVNDALREALGGGASEVPQGPPLSAGEKEALRVAVSSCWNVGSLSTEALGTTVVVAVNMGQDAKPVVSSIRLISSSGGSSGAANQAFEAARRAIIRCTRDGYNLPVEKYGQWKEIEMTFNPERMRIK
jgi:hypothetical protein